MGEWRNDRGETEAEIVARLRGEHVRPVRVPEPDVPAWVRPPSEFAQLWADRLIAKGYTQPFLTVGDLQLALRRIGGPGNNNLLTVLRRIHVATLERDGLDVL